MSKKDKLKKEIKRLKKQTDKALLKQQKAEKKLKRLKDLVRSQEEMQARTKPKKNKAAPVEKTAEHDQQDVSLNSTGVARSQREAWKRHSFLRDRYEAYLSAGDDRSDARAMANRDLEKQFGREFGYTEAELQDILT